MQSITRSVLLTAGLLLLALMTLTARPGASPPEQIEEQWQKYDAAVIDAATYKHENLHALFPLTFDDSTNGQRHFARHRR